METFLYAYALFLRGVQLLFLVLAALVAAACLLDWLVRTRRISPFSAPARFARSRVDPLLAPVERRVLRAGGNPASAPWWALAAVVIGGIVVISLLQFVGSQLVGLMHAARGGPRGILVFAVAATFGVLQLAIIVRVLASWIPSISPYSPWLRWAFVLSEPILGPLRRIIPTMGPIDVSPIVAYFLLRIVGGLVVGAIQ